MPPRHPEDLLIYKTLYIGNLPSNASRKVLAALFEEHEPKSIVLRSERGYGYIEFEPEMAERVISEFHGKSVFGRSLKVQEATFTEDLASK
jgi:RNA recognition motif-containing protein